MLVNFHFATLFLTLLFFAILWSSSFLSDALLSTAHGQVSNDPETPTISVPESITTEATSQDGAQITFTITASDNEDGTATLEEDGTTITQDDVGGNIGIFCDMPSTIIFPIGNTVVRCDAVDAGNNEATDTFTITVTPDTTAETGSTDTWYNNLQQTVDQIAATSSLPNSDVFPLILVASIVVIGAIVLSKYSKNRGRGRRIRIPSSAVVDITTRGGRNE